MHKPDICRRLYHKPPAMNHSVISLEQVKRWQIHKQKHALCIHVNENKADD